MLGLIRKDLIITLKKFNFIQLLILSISIIPIIQFPQFLVLAVTLVISFLMSILMSMSFSYDDNTRWNDFLVVLPVSEKEVVKAKYLLALLYLAAVLIIVITFFTLSSFRVTNKIYDLKIAILIAVAFGCTYNGVQIPLIYKFGMEIAKYSMFLIMILGYAVFGLAIVLKIDLNILIQNIFQNNKFYLAIVLVQFFFFFLSYKAAVIVYKYQRKRQ